MKKRILHILIFSLLLLFLVSGVGAVEDGIADRADSSNIGLASSVLDDAVSSSVDDGSCFESSDSEDHTNLCSYDEVYFVSLIEDGSPSVVEESDDLEEDEGEYIDVSDAYECLNQFRTEENVWQWNEDDKTKTYFNNDDSIWLKPLERDLEFEEAAKIRAKEIYQRFSHFRPNHHIFSTLLPQNLRAYGENIARYYFSAQEVTEAWKETDDNYSGQGHRRNMLDSKFNIVGIGGYKVNGIIYWVQDFGCSNISKDFDSYESFTFSNNTSRPEFKFEMPIYGSGNFIVKVDGIELARKEVINGRSSVFIYGLSPGEHSVELLYGGDYNYNAANKTETVFITEESIANPTFSYLNTLVQMGNGTVKLENDYVFDSDIDGDFKFGISVSSTYLTIDGQGHSIDGKGIARIFQSSIYGLTYKNIIFKNGYSGYGGAIYSKYQSFKIVNSSFIANSAEYSGGAVYSKGSVDIRGSRFTDNFANYSGGAVYSMMSIIISDSSFVENHAYDFGGAAYSDSNIRASNSNFSMNTNIPVFAKGNFTGSNNLLKNGEYYDFFANAMKDNGVVTLNKDWIASQTILVNGSNVVIDGKGHTIDGKGKTRIFYITGNNVTIRNLSIRNAYAFSTGGGIFSDNANLTLVDLSFVNCRAEAGAAIYGKGSMVSVANSTFISNTAFCGGGIYMGNGTLSVKGSSFKGNKGTNFGGGAIYAEGEVKLSDSKFIGNEGLSYGGAIATFKNSTLKIRNSSFENNTSNLYGGAIFSTGQAEVSSSSFIKNYAKDNGGAIFANNCTLNISNSSLVGNLANEGSSIMNKNSTVNVLKSTIMGNASLISGNVTLNDSKIVSGWVDSSSQSEGNAKVASKIYAISKLTVKYNVKKYLTITLKDAKGNALLKKKISVKIGSLKRALTTNSKGKASLLVSSLVPKTYVASIAFAGDAKYLMSKASIKLIVKKSYPRMTAKAKTFKLKAKTKKYSIVLKNNRGAVMKGAAVNLKINGKTYKAKTNKRGVATFKLINLKKKRNL